MPAQPAYAGGYSIPPQNSGPAALPPPPSIPPANNAYGANPGSIPPANNPYGAGPGSIPPTNNPYGARPGSIPPANNPYGGRPDSIPPTNNPPPTIPPSGSQPPHVRAGSPPASSMQGPGTVQRRASVPPVSGATPSLSMPQKPRGTRWGLVVFILLIDLGLAATGAWLLQAGLAEGATTTSNASVTSSSGTPTP